MNLNYVIVVTVLEGKNFPNRHDKYLVVDAKFDGEVMSTDPVNHVMRPFFNTELGWEVDKKGLQMHRLQRSPIKLQWYAVDLDLTKKETIGYMVLDIRLAQEKLETPKWYPLLNSKYQKEKPEVMMSLSLEKSVEEPQTPSSTHSYRRNSLNQDRNVFKKQSISSRPSPRQPPTKIPINVPSSNPHLEPVLLAQAGFYQIGPSQLCNEKFTFSITLSYAANLNKLSPPAMLKSSKGFFFYYSLFDNDVTTEKFSSLNEPEFLAERATVQISSSSEILSQYFEQHPSLEVILCCGDISLGSGQIPLGLLSTVKDRDKDEEPLCIEGSVRINPLENTSRVGGDDLSPFIRVSVVLQSIKKERDAHQHKQDKISAVDNSVSREKTQVQSLFRVSNPHENSSFVQKTFCPKIDEVQTNHNNMSDNSYGLRSRNASLINGSNPGSCNHSSDNSPPEVRDNILSSPPNSLPIKDDSNARHFSFSLDLSNFQATRLAHPINLFIRYSYPFFGTTSSMITHPDVEVHPKREVSIPHGYCSFNFATTFSMLKSTFWETPLILEILHRKKDGQEQLVGTARINLFQVLDAPSLSHVVDKKHGKRQMNTCKVMVMSPEGYEIGEIFASLSLIDFGPTSVLCDHHSSKSSLPCYNEVRSAIPSFTLPIMRQNGLTQDELLQAALEVELWQERQREIFRVQLKEKEMQHLSFLTSEWKQRDKERELLLQRKLQECQKLEDKLKVTLKDAELKEKQLSSQETELSMKLLKLDKEKEQHQRETKNQIESIKHEYNEMLTMERMKSRELEQKNSSLIRQIKELERDIQDQRAVFESLKMQANKDPDVHLRTEVNILIMEKAELQQKLETALSSKQKYKIQWGQVVRQMSALQQKLHNMECLEKERKEKISSFQQRILSSEEKNAVQTNEEIHGIVKEKVESLKSVVSPESIKQQMRQMSLAVHGAETSHLNSPIQNHHSISNATVNRLISNGPLQNSSAKCLTSISDEVTEKHNSNEHSSPSGLEKSPVSMTLHSKPSGIPKLSKDLPDLNGNTTSKDNNFLQKLLADKEKLILSGYKEQHKAIKDLNIHIDKAKLTS
ncbi:centrosomal protein of 120 kDa, partial [Parasteatoda tepidariorum]|uniref:centrosomal protein of 120 kDa n=1 Tax=Parasteatoda tepidariorum TaxID=114398 RepID=UPI0039BC3EEA